MTHKCVGNQTIIDSDNGLSPGRRQAIIWTNALILLIRHLGTNFSDIVIEILSFSLKKMRFKVLSAKWRPFCLGLNVLTLWPMVAPYDAIEWVNISSGNGLVLYSTKPLPAPTSTYHQWGLVPLAGGKFQTKCSSHQLLKWLKISIFKISFLFPRDQWVNIHLLSLVPIQLVLLLPWVFPVTFSSFPPRYEP